MTWKINNMRVQYNYPADDVKNGLVGGCAYSDDSVVQPFVLPNMNKWLPCLYVCSEFIMQMEIRTAARMAREKE